MERQYKDKFDACASAGNDFNQTVRVKLKDAEDYVGHVVVRADMSNCGCVNAHIPHGNKQIVALYIATRGFGWGFPVAYVSTIVAQDGSRNAVTVPGQQAIHSGMRNMVRFSFPVYADPDGKLLLDNHYTRSIVAEVRKLLGSNRVHYSKPVMNCNSGNLIVSATIDVDPETLSKAAQKRLCKAAESLGIDLHGNYIKQAD